MPTPPRLTLAALLLLGSVGSLVAQPTEAEAQVLIRAEEALERAKVAEDAPQSTGSLCSEGAPRGGRAADAGAAAPRAISGTASRAAASAAAEAKRWS